MCSKAVKNFVRLASQTQEEISGQAIEATYQITARRLLVIIIVYWTGSIIAFYNLFPVLAVVQDTHLDIRWPDIMIVPLWSLISIRSLLSTTVGEIWGECLNCRLFFGVCTRPSLPTRFASPDLLCLIIQSTTANPIVITRKPCFMALNLHTTNLVMVRHCPTTHDSNPSSLGILSILSNE